MPPGQKAVTRTRGRRPEAVRATQIGWDHGRNFILVLLILALWVLPGLPVCGDNGITGYVKPTWNSLLPPLSPPSRGKWVETTGKPIVSTCPGFPRHSNGENDEDSTAASGILVETVPLAYESDKLIPSPATPPSDPSVPLPHGPRRLTFTPSTPHAFLPTPTHTHPPWPPLAPPPPVPQLDPESMRAANNNQVAGKQHQPASGAVGQQPPQANVRVRLLVPPAAC
ncbi:hypothetical protein PTTG_08164 [Puccinia triticina 1-1 BBBD Race 1]|uniref:Uncharacterized protein n=1 Tax=Puccinia triticina (isolate 1-1 / race 1 (BBBD)) TaxID=630390 RepID=A0A180H2M7_PUCT1|nr:hypothetical protein PTTG_08164 [Puccinia triticina 1-1 BBBD Race 1]